MKRQWYRMLGVCLAFVCLGAASASSLFAVQENPAVFGAHFLSVKAADCTLLFNDGHSMLVDAGNPSETDRVLSALRAQNIDALDAIFLTHPHSDHLGGFLRIIPEIPIDRCYLPANFADDDSPEMETLRALLAEHLIAIVPLHSGDSFPLGYALCSAYQWENPDASVNNQSMLLHVQYGDRSLLLGADIENHAQKELGLLLGTALRADILKVPHHGQNLVMEEFHQAVKPTLAIITNSRFAPAVKRQIALFDKRHLPWLTTTYGTVVATTKGDEWDVRQLPREP